jgi:DNA uptake protein ComE-like DNA-binding protein
MAHLVKLIQSRTLHLQRVVNSNPYETVNSGNIGDFKALTRRLEELEARASVIESAPTLSTSETTLNGNQTAAVTTEVRRGLQPELDALNRAVRRYEKRATIQTMQTESRLLDIEARLTDAISLAAAAAQNGQQRYGFMSMLVDWIAAGLVLPLQAVGVLASLPFKTTITLISFGKMVITGRQPAEKGRKSTNGKSVSHSRFSGDRVQGKGLKR